MDTSQVQLARFSLGILVSLLGYIFLRKCFKKASLPLPPSPKPYPIIGNLLDLPPAGVRAAEWWSQHKALYGPISSVTVFGTTFVILNDEEVALDLMDRRSLIYSFRPPFTMAKLSGWDDSTSVLNYGPELRIHRREIQRYIGNPTALSQFTSIEEIEMQRLLLRILEEPDKAPEHMRRTAGAIILRIAYGYTPALREKDMLVSIAEKAMDIFSACFTGGSWMVDIFPSIRHLPSWLPGMSFKNQAAEWSEAMWKFTNLPFKFVQHKLVEGTATPSFAANLLERSEIDENTMKWIAATLYAGGSDTSVSVFSTFLLAMTLYPSVQVRAQREIDSVLGRGRLPSLKDKASGRLPYVEAVVKEALRWNIATPMGTPHVCSEENEYRGYRIPKGAIIMMNVWNIAHDPAKHDDPYSFKPERFLGPKAEPDSGQYSFGLGRRICPGKDLALQTVFLAISMVLATFRISPARDEKGREITPLYEYTVGGISHPKPFKYTISPRDQQAVSLINSTIDEHPIEKGHAEELRAMIEIDRS